MATLIGQKAPDFTASAILNDNEIATNFNLHSFIKGKYGVIFFYPLDFTFVCPSEIIALDHRTDDFNKKNAAVLTVSVDSHFTHLAYKKTSIEEGGIGNVRFPMVSDLNKKITSDYGILHNDSVALRGVFITDTNGFIRCQLINDLPIGRSIEEILRMIDAVTYNHIHGEVCPANWRPGKKAIQPTTEGIKNYLKNHDL